MRIVKGKELELVRDSSVPKEEPEVQWGRAETHLVEGCTRKLLESQAPRMDACVQFWWQGLRRLEGRAWWTLVF